MSKVPGRRVAVLPQGLDRHEVGRHVFGKTGSVRLNPAEVDFAELAFAQLLDEVQLRAVDFLQHDIHLKYFFGTHK